MKLVFVYDSEMRMEALVGFEYKHDKWQINLIFTRKLAKCNQVMFCFVCIVFVS